MVFSAVFSTVVVESRWSFEELRDKFASSSGSTNADPEEDAAGSASAAVFSSAILTISFSSERIGCALNDDR